MTLCIVLHDLELYEAKHARDEKEERGEGEQEREYKRGTKMEQRRCSCSLKTAHETQHSTGAKGCK